MSRRLTMLSACLLALSRADADPPAETAKKPVLWFPSTVGDTLVYDETRSTSDGKSTRRITSTVVSIHRSDESVAVAIQQDSPPLESSIFRRDEPAGLESS